MSIITRLSHPFPVVERLLCLGLLGYNNHYENWFVTGSALLSDNCIFCGGEEEDGILHCCMGRKEVKQFLWKVHLFLFFFPTSWFNLFLHLEWEATMELDILLIWIIRHGCLWQQSTGHEDPTFVQDAGLIWPLWVLFEASPNLPSGVGGISGFCLQKRSLLVSDPPWLSMAPSQYPPSSSVTEGWSKGKGVHPEFQAEKHTVYLQ